MSEQQRVLLAIVLSIGIIWVWQAFFAPPPPLPADLSKPEVTAESPTTGSDDVAANDVVANAVDSDSPSPSTDESVEGEPAALEGPAPVEPESRSFETTEYMGELSNRTVRLSRWELRSYQEQTSESSEAAESTDSIKRPVSLVTAKDRDEAYQARLVWSVGDGEAPPMAFVPGAGNRLSASTAEGVELGVSVATTELPYALDYTLTAVNGGASAVSLSAGIQLAVDASKSEESGGGGLFGGAGRAGQVVTGVCSTALGLERQSYDDLEEETYAPDSAARWAGIDKQYFVIGATSTTPNAARCVAERAGDNLQVVYRFIEESIPAGGRWEKKLTVYLGPKRDELLRKIEPTLIEIVDYDFIGIPLGFMARPMIFLLNVFHGWTASWGIAIMILTFLVKLLLFPITYKSIVSMRKMQLLKPELDKLKERFPDDRERQQLEQLKLFKEKGVNPLGGCLPMLLQMPVWIALYRALWTSVDLYQQSFLWLPDLTAKEPGLPFLALGLGVTMFIQQMVTPMSAGSDNQQAKIMKWVMPPMFTFIMVGLPSGLVLYIFVNTVISIAQQAVINQRTKSL